VTQQVLPPMLSIVDNLPPPNDAVPFGLQYEVRRMHQRVADAVADPTGRIKLFLNRISAPDLSDDIRKLTCLQALHCDHNPLLTRLPQSVLTLSPTLRVLNLSHCSLDALPEALNDFVHLTDLDVSHNQLRSFVWDCSGLLANLRNLNVAHNPIRAVSPSTVDLMHAVRAKEIRLKEVSLASPQLLHLVPLPDLLPCRFPVTEPWGVLPEGCARLPVAAFECVVCKRPLLEVPLYNTVYVDFVRILATCPAPSHLLATSMASDSDVGESTPRTERRSDDEAAPSLLMPVLRPVCSGHHSTCLATLHRTLLLPRVQQRATL